MGTPQSDWIAGDFSSHSSRTREADSRPEPPSFVGHRWEVQKAYNLGQHGAVQFACNKALGKGRRMGLHGRVQRNHKTLVC